MKRGSKLRKQTRSCFVLLERLDGKTVSQYLKKRHSSFEVRKDRRNKREGERSRTFRRYSKTHRSERDGRELRESVLRGERKFRRKRKSRAKPLLYTDDEEDTNFACSKENTFKNFGQSETQEKLLNGESSIACERVENVEGKSKFKVEASESTKSPVCESISVEYQQPKVEERLSIIKSEPESSLSCAIGSNENLSFQRLEGFWERRKENLTGEMNSSDRNSNSKRGCEGGVESEIEIVEEFMRGGSVGSSGGVIGVKNERESVRVAKQEVEDDGNESREENEDDIETVIFERDFVEEHKEDAKVFEEAERVMRSTSGKFQKQKIMNRKKRKLIKFKRKRSMISRNLAKVKKLRKEFSEVCDRGPQPSASDLYIKEVRALVKRLHDLYGIISQVQKDLPKNPELSSHFLRTMHAQKEDFHKEMKKSHKTILKAYENMVKSAGKGNKLPSEAGKRPPLGKEDVANVKSRCTEGSSEEKKRTKKAEEEGSDPSSREVPSKPTGMGGRIPKKVVSDKIEAPVPVVTTPGASEAPPHGGKSEGEGSPVNQNTGANVTPAPPPPANAPTKSPQRPPQRPPQQPPQQPPNEPRPVRDNTWMVQIPPQQILRSAPQTDNGFHRERPSFSKQPCYWSNRTYFYKTNGDVRDPRVQQASQDPHRVGPRGPQVNHRHPPRAPNPPPNGRGRYQGYGFPAHGAAAGPVTYYPPNSSPGVFHAPARFFSQGHPLPGTPIPPLMNLHIHPSGFNRPQMPAAGAQMSRYPPVFNGNPSAVVRPEPPVFHPASSVAARPEPPVQNMQAPAYVIPQPNVSNIGPNTFNISWRGCFPQESVQYPAPRPPFPRNDNPVRTVATGFAAYMQPSPPVQRSTAHPEAGMQTHVDSGQALIPQEMQRPPCADVLANSPREAEKSPSFVLDPTVPQKLTMRNYRLEAGPVIGTEAQVVSVKVEEDCERVPLWHQPVAKEEPVEEDTGPGKLIKTDSTSRVYVCAQNECKNPGVKICEGCLSVIYCGETCQLKHWILKHKTECHQLKELRG